MMESRNANERISTCRAKPHAGRRRRYQKSTSLVDGRKSTAKIQTTFLIAIPTRKGWFGGTHPSYAMGSTQLHTNYLERKAYGEQRRPDSTY
jgi:hypothetical protein